MNILEIRDLDFTTIAVNTDNGIGLATFNGIATAGVPAPADLSQAVTRPVGSNQLTCQVTLDVTSLTDNGGNPVQVTTSQAQILQRGDARADGTINIADALFIAQYLVGLRDACTAALDTTCLHLVNAASVRQDGAFDKTTIADALFIDQYLVGLRDEFYNVAP